MQGDQNPRATSTFQEFGSDEQMGKLYMALGEAQAAFKEIKRTKSVTVRMKTGSSYTFKYAPLEDLLAATREALTKNGLAVITPIGRDPREAKVMTVLAHKDGGRIVTTFGFPPEPDIKDLAGQITYLRRYSYSAMLNLAADDDDDDNGNRNIREQQRSSGPVRAPGANGAAQPTARHADGNSSRAVGSTPQADGDLPPMIAEAGDADYLWMLQVQEYAKEVGIPTSAVKLPTRRISLLSTANSLLRAVNIARVASGKEEVKRPATVASDEGPYEEPNGGDQQAPFATPEQIGSIEAYIDKWEAHGQDRLVDPDTEEVWVFEDTDLLLLSVDDADRMLICFREAEPALV